ncbi:zinc finger matrin-type protein 5 [Tribolium madens]|uniref:zinc finger matrin-type protein 5 n=1 Tax=Tribolium madens TaxID=41895 RepID=UPI001CF746D1|nr:zinc finger matrin-type protein 5 [Tribolium madens]
MRRRYYCDYCDKSFIDDLDARKKHLQSSYHIKLRNLHYELHRDPRTILKEECEKTPCRRFLSNGVCQFSGICKYTHYTPEQLWEIKLRVDSEEQGKQIRVPTMESWLQTYSEKHSKENTDLVHIPWSYPEQLEHRTDLPPSIKKLKPEHFVQENFEEWGK